MVASTQEVVSCTGFVAVLVLMLLLEWYTLQQNAIISVCFRYGDYSILYKHNFLPSATYYREILDCNMISLYIDQISSVGLRFSLGLILVRIVS